MAKCSQCGAEVELGDQFCAFCGAAVVRLPQNPQIQNTATVTNYTSNAQILPVVALKGPLGDIKTAPVGFSWTAFLFAGFVPFFRKDFVTGCAVWGALFVIPYVLGFVLGFVLSFLRLASIETIMILGWFVDVLCALAVVVFMGLKYNEIYIKKLIKQGYKPNDANSKYILGIKYGIRTK